jgi:hypothetical protein
MQNQSPKAIARLLETHISWVLLAGRYAYKIKKAVDLGFLSYTSLEARRFYCEEEIRLNRRLAPRLYLNVVSIGGSLDDPELGASPAIEYAVRMRRFAASKQLDRLAKRNKISPLLIDNLASTLARFHAGLPKADAKSSYGTAGAIYSDMEQNFAQLSMLMTQPDDFALLVALKDASEKEYSACRNLFQERLSQGFVRECHGDLHLGNIVLIGEQAVPFDGIEFNPSLRWIDVVSELAFTAMDLQWHQLTGLASRFLNAYFEATGDYAGTRLLRFYMAYRAMVRAKVNALRASQAGLPIAESTLARSNCYSLLQQAAGYFNSRQAMLIITHGLPGSGKTTFSQLALERLQAIRLRSDVERKRMFALDPLADSRARTGLDLYSAEITQRTYAHLLALARQLLEAGSPVIVDAAFILKSEREPFRQLAEELKIPFAISSIQASNETLRARIKQRLQAANDASEADIAVLEKVIQGRQPLSQQEQSCVAVFLNESAGLVADCAAWEKLYRLLGLHSGE